MIPRTRGRHVYLGGMRGHVDLKAALPGGFERTKFTDEWQWLAVVLVRMRNEASLHFIRFTAFVAHVHGLGHGFVHGQSMLDQKLVIRKTFLALVAVQRDLGGVLRAVFAVHAHAHERSSALFAPPLQILDGVVVCFLRVDLEFLEALLERTARALDLLQVHSSMRAHVCAVVGRVVARRALERDVVRLQVFAQRVLRAGSVVAMDAPVHHWHWVRYIVLVQDSLYLGPYLVLVHRVEFCLGH